MKLKIKSIRKYTHHSVIEAVVGENGFTEIREVLSQANRDCVEIYKGDELISLVFEPDTITYDQEVHCETNL